MRILNITNTIPYPTTSGGALRNYNLLRRIAARHEVWLATHLYAPQEIEGVPHLQGFCQEVCTALMMRRPKIEHLPGLLRYALAGRPPELKFLHSTELERHIHRLCAQVQFDIIQIEESRMALYLESVPASQRGRRVLAFYDIAFAQTARFWPLERTIGGRARMWFYSQMMRRWEPRYAGRYDRCTTVSESDRQLLLAANPRLRVDVVPNGVDTHLYQPLPANNGAPALLFIGNMSYLPCVDAAVYLVRDILPHIRRAGRDVELWIVGADPAPQVLQLAGDGVHVTGRVPDIEPYYARARVSVVPLRAGGGTRLKILESMALGRPVVATSIGCEGLDVAGGEHLYIADDAEQFANYVVRLLSDAGDYARVVGNARRLVVERYDWDAIAARLLSIYEELAQAGHNSPRTAG